MLPKMSARSALVGKNFLALFHIISYRFYMDQHNLNYPSVTLTRVFLLTRVEFLRVFNLVSVVYHFRRVQLVAHVRFWISCFG